MYEVKIYHHTKDLVRGDLEDKLELIGVEHFNSRKSAKNYILQEVRGKKGVQESWHSGDNPSRVIWFTGVEWQHENSGETMYEYYQYILKKVQAR